MSDPDDSPERIERPVQATPAFFVETVTEHHDRGDIDGGLCTIRMPDGSRRRFVVGRDLEEMDETDYLVEAVDDLIELLDAEDIGQPFDTTIPVEDVDRVVEEATTDGVITVRFDPAGLSDLLAGFLAEGVFATEG